MADCVAPMAAGDRVADQRRDPPGHGGNQGESEM